MGKDKNVKKKSQALGGNSRFHACSVVHTAGHALGYPMHDLTAIILEHGLDDCREPIEHRVRYYEQRLHYWAEHEKSCYQD